MLFHLIQGTHWLLHYFLSQDTFCIFSVILKISLHLFSGGNFLLFIRCLLYFSCPIGNAFAIREWQPAQFRQE